MREKVKRYLSALSERASKIANSPEKLEKLASKASDKLNAIGVESGAIKEGAHVLVTFIRMIQAYIKGEYRIVPWQTLLAITGGVLYFLIPLDVIPDFIPVLGFADDIAALLWIYKSVRSDVEDFEQFYIAAKTEEAPVNTPENDQ
jgi:uncharacterized membrane protein YkvA (DUF1232 family)